MRLMNSKRNVLLSLATLLVIVAVAVHFLSPGGKSHAGNGTLKLSPASSSVNTSQSLTVTVKLNTAGVNVSAIQANLNYPTSIFGQLSPSDVTIAPQFTNVAQKATANGQIRLALGTDVNTFVTGDVDVATITFHPIAAGSASVIWASGTEVDDPASNDIAPVQSNGLYTITAVSSGGGGSTSPGGSTGGGTGTSGSGTTKPSGSTSSTSTKPSSTGTAATPAAPAEGAAAPVAAAGTTAPIISDLAVTGVDKGKPVVSWTTDVASTSAVEYGTSTSYGFAAAAIGTTTSHSVALDGSKMLPFSTYYVRVTSGTDAGSTLATTSFQTLGNSVTIEVKDWLGNPVAGATVKLGDQTVTTDKDGKATFTNVQAGDTTVVISHNGTTKTSKVSVKPDGSIATPQKFLVQASSQLPAATLLLVLGFLVVSGGGYASYRYRTKLGLLVHEAEHDLGIGGSADDDTVVTPSDNKEIRSVVPTLSGPTATPTITPKSANADKPLGTDNTSFMNTIEDVPSAPQPGEITHPSSKDEK
jgi:hypothetical protein